MNFTCPSVMGQHITATTGSALADRRHGQPGPETAQCPHHEAELREIHYSRNGNDRDQKRPCEAADTILVGDKPADHGYVLSPPPRTVVKSFRGLRARRSNAPQSSCGEPGFVMGGLSPLHQRARAQ